MTKYTNTASGAADKVLAYLDDLSDDAAAHIFPSDLAKCMTSECVVEVVSVRAGNPNERTVPLFSREQVVAALASAPAQPVAEPAPSATAHVGDSLFESWFSEYNPAHRGTKQQMRDAYAAGMGDPKAQPSPKAPATQQPEGDVVAYLDVGANGYLDLGSELSEDALQQLPKGRHALVIAGTYGIDGYVAAPQPSYTAQAAPAAVAGPSWEALHHAWMKIGADVAGLDWGAFTNAVRYAPTTQPAPQQEPVEMPAAIEQMATGRYKVVPSHESMFHRWAVVAGTGAQQLYLGREVECQNMAHKFAGAFLDGVYVALRNAAPQPSPAAQGDAPCAAPPTQLPHALLAMWRRRAGP